MIANDSIRIYDDRGTTANTRRAAEIQDGVSNSCVFKVGLDAKDRNVYSNIIVLMDEGHHLTRPHPLYSFQLKNLRELMYMARNTDLLWCIYYTYVFDNLCIDSVQHTA